MNKQLKKILVFGAIVIASTGCTQKNVVLDKKDDGSKYASNQGAETNTTKKYGFLDNANSSNTNNLVANDSKLGEDIVASNGSNGGLNSNAIGNNSTSSNGLNTVFFDYDVFVLDEMNRKGVKNNSAFLLPKKEKVKLEGNCDEWGSDEYNFALGLKRVKSVKDALIEDGLLEENIMTVSLGESNPICTEKTDECWKKNRRVDFIEIR